MKIPAKFVASVFFLAVIKGVVSLNPDSEMVQDPSKDSTGAGTPNARQIQSSESTPSIAVIADSYSGIKVLRPYYASNIGMIWREVGTSYGNERIRIRNRGDFLDVSRVNTQDRGGFASPVGDRDIRPGSAGVASPSLPMLPSNTYRSGNDGVKGGGALGNPSRDDGSRPFPGPSGQGNGNYGVRNPSGSRPRANGQDREVPARGGNPPRELGGQTASPSGGNQVPPVPPKPQGTGTDDSASYAKGKGVSPDANLFAGIVNNFAFKLTESLNLESNFVVSPLSIFVALSMCYLGAEGSTKAQLEQALGLNDYAVHGIHLHQGISDLLSMVSPDSEEYRLFFANGLFLGKDFPVEESFKEDAQKYYGAELKNLDFGKRAASLRAVNEWVANSTRNTIESLLSDPLPDSTKLVVLNAIFFKGIWEKQFPREFTFDASFFTLDGQERTVPFMNIFREKFQMFRSEEHRHAFIKLPYKGDQVSMIIALPDNHEEAPMSSVTDQILCHVRDAMVSTQMDIVSIPKFRLEYLQSLQEPLMDLGIRDIFGSSVNLSKMRKPNDVFVSSILHKAVVDVNEEGTTAAASTALQATPYTSGSRNDFAANHPFAFYIVHEESGLVLFYGKIYDIGEDARAPPSNGRRNNQAPPSDVGSSPRVPSDNARDNIPAPPDNARDNIPAPPDNARDNIQAPPSNIRNSPQVPPGWDRPQVPSYRRESPYIRQNNRG